LHGDDRPLQREAAQDEQPCIDPEEPRAWKRAPVGSAHAQRIGADQNGEQRAGNGEEHAEAELRGGPGHRLPIRKAAGGACLEPWFRRQPLAREPPDGNSPKNRQKGDDHGHPAIFLDSSGEKGGARTIRPASPVLRMSATPPLLRGPADSAARNPPLLRARCSRMPIGRLPAAPFPNSRGEAAWWASATPASWPATDCRRLPCPGTGSTPG